LLLGGTAAPALAAPVSVSLDSLGAGTNLFIHYESPGSSTFHDWYVFAGQYHVSINNGTPFNSFCVDLDHTVQVGQTFMANVMPTSGLMGGGQVAYLYDKYGMTTMGDPTKAAALQLAFWDLTTDGGDGLSHGRFQFLGSSAIAAQVDAYLTEAKNQSHNGRWLDASASGSGQNRGQSVLSPTPEPATVALLGAGLMSLGGGWWLRRRRA
jgi:hypothetical protein